MKIVPPVSHQEFIEIVNERFKRYPLSHTEKAKIKILSKEDLYRVYMKWRNGPEGKNDVISFIFNLVIGKNS